LEDTGQAQVQKLVGIERPNGEIRWAYVNATPMWTGMSLKARRGRDDVRRHHREAGGLNLTFLLWRRLAGG
jgi:hypothetical protein